MALRRSKDWRVLVDYFSANNVTGTPAFGKQPCVPCLNCGADVSLSSMTVAPEDLAKCSSLDLDTILKYGGPPQPMPLGRIIIQLADILLLFDETPLSEALSELIGWEHVSFNPTSN
jgi:hypothetical protein